MNRSPFLAVAALLALAPTVSAADAPCTITVSSHPFSSVREFVLRNAAGMEVGISNYGARLTSIKVPDREGVTADVVLGYDSLEGYVNALKRPFFGATVGRYANRIAEGKFTLDGVAYALPVNAGPNHIHGGRMGFDKVVWAAETIPGGVRLSYRAKDGEEGYPGNLDVVVVYTLTEFNALRIAYTATTDQPTIVNLTNHSYFNLAGEGSPTVLDHFLTIHAERFLVADATHIPTGEVREVAGTPLDFRSPKRVGQDIEAAYSQLKYPRGYDQAFLVEGVVGELRPAATLYDPGSGRQMDVYTEEPTVHLYSGNFLDPRLIGKSGRPYHSRSALCLETQHAPNSPNHPEWPSTILRPGETYSSSTEFRFSVR